MDNNNCCKKCLIFFGVIIVLGLAAFFIVNPRNGSPEPIAPEQVTESSDYLYGVPPAPPFQEAEATISNFVTDGCSEAPVELVGYIIEVKENEDPNALIMFSQGAVLIIQDENGRRDKYSIDTATTSNADMSYLPSILIPGNKVEMKVQYCGSGNFNYIMYLKNMQRN
jgi:hypothetical protein